MRQPFTEYELAEYARIEKQKVEDAAILAKAHAEKVED